MVNKVWLVATTPLTVHGRAYNTGDRFALSALDSGALLVARKAVLAPLNSRELKEHQAEQSFAPKRKRGRPRKSDTTAPSYRRRDLQAEE